MQAEEHAEVWAAEVLTEVPTEVLTDVPAEGPAAELQAVEVPAEMQAV